LVKTAYLFIVIACSLFGEVMVGIKEGNNLTMGKIVKGEVINIIIIIIIIVVVVVVVVVGIEIIIIIVVKFVKVVIGMVEN
jgi:hypothetical protein